MPDANATVSVITLEGLGALFEALRRRQYTLVGPTVGDGAIVYGELQSPADLPRGWTDEQDGGTYRLVRRNDEAVFGYVVGPHSWKQFLFPPATRLWQGQRTEAGGFEMRAVPAEPPRYAFIGVRSCELHAIAIQDRVFVGGAHVDPTYQARRERAFFVAVNCGQAGGTCFCVSMQTGPKATGGFDLALTETLEGGRHRFVVEVGSERGAEVLRDVPRAAATAEDLAAARAATERAARSDGPDDGHDRHQGPALPQLRASTLGRRRLAVPDLRQLHDGLPDLLLQHGRGHRGPDRRRTPSGGGSGTRASRWIIPMSTAGTSGVRRGRGTASG